jgi:hypothetical protein
MKFVNRFLEVVVVKRHGNVVRIRQSKSRGMRWAGHVARVGEEREVYRVLVGKSEGKRPLGRPKA